MTRALITGGAGFVGSHLAEALLERGWRVTVLDDLSTGSIENIAHLKGHAQFAYVLDSVLNRPLLLELIDSVDVTFHLAAAVGVRLIVERPVHTIETNIKATEIVLELASRKRKPVLLTSTSEIYGKLNKPRFNEEDDLVLGPTSRARWCYAASKIIDEFLARAYHKEKGAPNVVVRLFNTIGPRQTGQYGMVVPRLRGIDGQVQVSYRPLPTLAAFLHRTLLFRWLGLWRGAYRHFRRDAFDPLGAGRAPLRSQLRARRGAGEIARPPRESGSSL
jgi:UDP-glucose 4-epimerase